MLSKENVKIACAPINWTNDDLPELGGELTFEQCISEMALAGYAGSEIGNKYPKDPAVLKKALDLRQLQICNGWFSSYFTTKPLEETVEAFIEHRDFLFEMGAKVIGVGEVGSSVHGIESEPLFTNRPHLSDDQFTALASGLEEIGKLAQEKGMEVAFHYHVGTGIETFEEIDKVMEMTDPNLVHLLFDTGHATVAGENPLEILKKYAPRVKHVHIKDVRSDILEKVKGENLSFLQGIKAGLFTVPGDGDMVEMEEVFNVLKESNYKGWIVVEAEQDPRVADPLEYAIKARKFIKEKMGV
ncbi:myo-inosose-2 dehydratase [Sporosarcina sp. CAU 1771]